MTKKYFEDIDIGETHELGKWSITREELVSFAERYDPQPFHVDEAAAKESMYGGLIASGWQTGALTMRVMVDEYLQDTASMGARGVDTVRWHRPARPGDEITVQLAVLEKGPSNTGRPGTVYARTIGTNQEGEKVLSWVNLFLIQHQKE